MALSDREEQLLKELEGTLTPAATRHRYKGMLGVTGVGIGMGMLLAGAMLPLVPLGVAGYLVMLAGWMTALNSTLGDSFRGRFRSRVERAAQERQELRNRRRR